MAQMKRLLTRQIEARDAYHKALSDEGGRHYLEIKKAKADYLELIGLE